MKRNFIFLALTLVIVCAFSLYLIIHQSRTDTQPPTITFTDEVLELSTLDPKEAFLQGVAAQDAEDGDVTASVVVSSIQLVDRDGAIRVTYAAFDAAGNVAKAIRQARFTDYESPRFSLNSSLTFSYNSGFDIFKYVRAEDRLDGDISHRIRITSLDPASISAIGIHQVELTVSNSLGETVTLIVPVEVYGAGSYGAKLTLTDYLVYLPAGAALEAERYLDAYTNANIPVSLREGLPEGYHLEIKSDVQPDVPGVYTVEYRVTKTTGTGTNAKETTGYAKLIVVVEG